MIISKTPYRVSLFGGGTDYSSWYEKYGGAVLGGSINKYCYITARSLPRFFGHRNRVVWSKIELTDSYKDIEHNSVRGCLQYFDMNGLEIHHDGDLPSNSGVGSSSSFTVGLLNCLHRFRGNQASKKMLALEAIHVERELLSEAVGSQDQILASFGGFRLVNFKQDGDFVTDEPITLDIVRELEQHLMLVYTSKSRISFDIAKSYIKSAEYLKDEYRQSYDLVYAGMDALKVKDYIKVGELLHTSWEIKKNRGIGVSDENLDLLYDNAIRNGAIGGKLIGAGGGGFMLLLVPPEKRANVLHGLDGYIEVPFSFEMDGSTIVFDNGDRYDI